MVLSQLIRSKRMFCYKGLFATLLILSSCSTESKIKSLAQDYFNTNIVKKSNDTTAYKVIDIQIKEVTKKTVLLSIINSIAADTSGISDDSLFLIEKREEYYKLLKDSSCSAYNLEMIKEQITVGEEYIKFLVDDKKKKKEKLDSTIDKYNKIYANDDGEIDHYVATISFYTTKFNSYGERIKESYNLLVYTNPYQVIDSNKKK